MEKLPLKLSQATGVPYYRQIVDQLADLVRSGQLAPGSLLPSVRDLAAQLLVSLITVRNAYDDLENAGLIVRRQGYRHLRGGPRGHGVAGAGAPEARAVLSDAIGHVSRLGLDTAAILALVHELAAPRGRQRCTAVKGRSHERQPRARFASRPTRVLAEAVATCGAGPRQPDDPRAARRAAAARREAGMDE